MWQLSCWFAIYCMCVLCLCPVASSEQTHIQYHVRMWWRVSASQGCLCVSAGEAFGATHDSRWGSVVCSWWEVLQSGTWSLGCWACHAHCWATPTTHTGQHEVDTPISHQQGLQCIPYPEPSTGAHAKTICVCSCVHMYVCIYCTCPACICVQSDLTYSHTSVLHESADDVRELDTYIIADLFP